MNNHHAMQKPEPTLLLNYIFDLDPHAVIPVIEKGLELEQLQSITDNSPEVQRRVLHSRALLCILRALRLGL